MSRLLAIEWDQHEARFVVASNARSRLTIEQAGAFSLPVPAEGEKLSGQAIGEAIRTGLKDRRVTGGAALVGVSRSSIELCQLGLPPARDEDLPDLVRHQAVRELSSMTDSTLLDFVPLPSPPGEARTVLAAALSSEQFEQIQAAASAAGLKPQRLLIRPHAAGSHFQRQMQPRERVSLLVTCLEEEVDLAVLVDGQVLLCRSVRLPQGNEGDAAEVPMLAEIRRTIFAVQNQPGGGPVSAVYVCGDGPEYRELAQRIQDELSLPAEVFQPFQGQRLSRGLSEQLPDHAGRYVSLLGMLADEAAQSHSIDFLNPRKKKEPVSRQRIAIFAAAAVALLVFGIGYLAYEKFAEVDAQIAELTKQQKSLDTSIKRAAAKEAAVAAIEEWLMADVVWLDELRDLSLRFPKPRDAVILRMTLSGKPTGGGAIELEGLVRDPSIVGQMESNLRDDYHEVRTKRVQESVQGANHTWKFDSSLVVGSRDKSKYQSHLSPAGTTAGANRAPRVASRDAVDLDVVGDRER
jgi:Tfp pilus assembly PilM family ATPase